MMGMKEAGFVKNFGALFSLEWAFGNVISIIPS